MPRYDLDKQVDSPRAIQVCHLYGLAMLAGVHPDEVVCFQGPPGWFDRVMTFDGKWHRFRAMERP